MSNYFSNLWIKAGLIFVLIGWSPLMGVIFLAGIGLWPDPNPNPVGLGLLFFLTFWPAVICLVIVAYQVLRDRD